MELIKWFFNAIADPRLYFGLMVLALVGMVWKREIFTSKAVGYGVLLFLTMFFGGGRDSELPAHRHKPERADRRPHLPLVFFTGIRCARPC